MGKLVVIKLGDGSFEQGFPVTLQIWEDDHAEQSGSTSTPRQLTGGSPKPYASLPVVETTGRLPPAPEIPEYYNGWATTYRRLGLRSRLEAKPAQVTNISNIEDCYKAADELQERLNSWLLSASFRAIREKLLEQLMPADVIRVIIQTEDPQLRRLPWHLWDFCQRYPKAEIALSARDYQRVKQSTSHKVRILAVLGNSIGINTQADRLLLEQLPGAEICFLVEPQREELNEHLWKQTWDILFFAGHSSSQIISSPGCESEETGQIYINQTESLTIDQLEFALKKAVERGLKIAIFNSCDGLGLARDLGSLQIPQIIVMREPVPDKVAQEFLKFFLEAFSRDEPFYLAVREARERLQGLEAQFPCATWLPVICQNPAVVPPTWQELCPDHTVKTADQGDGVQDSRQAEIYRPVSELPLRHPRSKIQCLRSLLMASLIVTLAIMGIRQMGFIQSWELQAFDQLMRLRPQEGPDSRLLLVAITETDFQLAEQKTRKGSLSDEALTKLFEKLEAFKPRAIGLDIYREDPATQGKLASHLRDNPHFFAICKASDSRSREPGVSPPPEVPPERQGFNDLVVDPDGILRRHLIAMEPSSTSPCTASYAFSAMLAFQYLKAKGIPIQYTDNNDLKLGDVVVPRMQTLTGGYQRIDNWGYQVLLNYRSAYGSPLEVAEKVTLKDVLTNKVNPNDLKGRVILIGVTAQSAGDFHPTPYSVGRGYYQEIPGVVVHAQMVSQILSAVLDQRPLLWVIPQWGEALWVFCWSLLGGGLAWRIRHPLGLAFAGTVAVGVLYGLGFALLIRGGWIPVVPSGLALVVTGASVIVLTNSQEKTSPTTFLQ